jgi:hypothetical protein
MAVMRMPAPLVRRRRHYTARRARAQPLLNDIRLCLNDAVREEAAAILPQFAGSIRACEPLETAASAR